MNDHDLMEAMFEAITGLKVEITDMKADITGIKTDMAGMKTDMADMKAELKADITNLRTELKSDIQKINIQLENDVIPRLNTIEECYTDTYKRYVAETDDIQQLKTDVSLLKAAVSRLYQSA